MTVKTNGVVYHTGTGRPLFRFASRDAKDVRDKVVGFINSLDGVRPISRLASEYPKHGLYETTIGRVSAVISTIH